MWTSLSPHVRGLFFHDFGIVAIQGTPHQYRHRFSILNTSKRAWSIERVTPTCGCIASEFTQTPVRPGESAEVELVLTVYESGHKIERAVVYFSEPCMDSIHLELKAVVRRSSQLMVPQLHVELGQNPVLLPIVWASHVDEPPPLPEFVSTNPKLLTVRFTEWVLAVPINQEAGKPSRWEGVIELVASDLPDEDSRQGTLVIRVGEIEQATVTIHLLD